MYYEWPGVPIFESKTSERDNLVMLIYASDLDDWGSIGVTHFCHV